ncbi:MAG TPA: PAS domain S-box protein [Steroidobacteraceae bacterium]|nr:PAS domain S-box protein [Steroidobacteraceae bacterium]
MIPSRLKSFTSRRKKQYSDRFFDLSMDLMCVVGFDGYLKQVNPMWTHLLGWAEAELVDQPAISVVHPADHIVLRTAREKVQAGLSPGRVEIRYRHKNGSYRWIWWNVFPRPEEEVVYAIGRDITSQKQDEVLKSGQKEILEMVARGQPLKETLNALAHMLETHSPDMKCSILLLDADGMHLQHGAAPSLPIEYCNAIDGSLIGDNAGSCGTAAFRGEPVLVEDIANDPLWKDFSALARQYDLHSCWSAPIFDSARRVLGTFAVYYDKNAGPVSRYQDLIDVATQIAAIAIIRDHDEAALREAQTRHRRLIESGIIGVMVSGTDGHITDANDAFLQMLGQNRADLEAGMLRWDTLTPPEWRWVDEHIISELKRCGSCAPIEKEYFHKDGSRVPVLASVALLDGSASEGLCLIQDLTERKKADYALQRSEHVLRLFVEHTPAAIAMFDRDMKYMLVSNRYCSDFGLGKQALLGRSHYEIFPDIPQHWKDTHQRCLNGASERCDQELYKRANGESEWVQWEIHPWYEPTGEVGGIILATEVITERKQAEEELRTSEEKFTTIFRNAPVWMAITDMANGKYVDVNDYVLDAAGFTRDEVLGHTAEELGWLKPGARRLLLNEINKYGRINGLEMTFHSKNGEQLHGLVTGTGVTIAGKPCLLTVSADITERTRAEKALRERGTYLNKIINNIGDPMFVKDEQLRFVLVNENFCTLFNLQREDIIGKTLAEETPLEEREHFWRVDRQVLTDGQDNVCEEMLTIRGGDTRVISTRKTRYVDDAGNKFVIGVIHDLTDRKRLEEQLLQAQKMEAVGTLAGGIAHDFNNILAAIKGYTQLAIEEAKAQPAVQGHLDVVLQGALRATELVKQITTFSRQQDTQRAPVKLQKVVSETLVLLRATIPTTIEIKTVLDSQASAVLADPTQMQQIIMNLCTNAWHALKSRPGRIEIRIDSAQLDADFTRLHPVLQPGPHVRLCVTDNGSGMDTITLGRIFEPFFTTKGPGEGSGLGLAVVHGIMRAHGGAIVVNSTVNVGTSFELYFAALDPLLTEESNVLRPAATLPSVGHQERILLVDDEPALVQLGTRILERMGYQVKAFNSSLEAIAAARSAPNDFDLVISDLAMPGMSGLDLVEQLRKLRPDVPVIVVSGYVDSATQERINAIGVQNVLLKPYTIEALGDALEQILVTNNKPKSDR